MMLVVVMAAPAPAQGRYSKIRIPMSSKEGLRAIARLGIAVDHVGGKPGRWVDVFVNEQEVSLLRQSGLPFTTLIDDWDQDYQTRLGQDRSALVKSSLAPQVKNFHLGSMGGYLTLEEVGVELDSMHMKFPTLVTAKDTIGLTIEGRPIWVVKISKNAVVGEPEPQALYTGLIHAREPAGMMTLVYFMWYLLENYGTDQEVTSLLDHRELFFVPVINADGYAYNQALRPGGGGMWRKNRRLNAGGTYGIDLNRNYGYQWGYDNVGSSSNPGSEVYRGTGPFSEPETDAIRFLCESEGLTNGFTVALNYHTYGNLLIYPWGYADTDTKDSLIFRQMGEDMTSISRNTYGTGGQTVGYITNGDSDDWMYGESGSKPRIFSMTPEVGDELDGFWALPSRILLIAQENLEANLYLAHAAGEFITVGSTAVHGNPAADSLRIDILLVNKGVAQLPSTVTLVAQSADVTILTPSFASAPWQGVPLSIRAGKKPPWLPGEMVSINLEISYEGGLTLDTITFRLEPVSIIYADDAESTKSRWISSSNTLTDWDTTSEVSHSGNYSFTDSPRTDYPDNGSSAFTLGSIFTLTGSAAELRFWTRWHIETNYDCATVEASTDDGATWTPLQGKYTGRGSGAGTQVPEFSPGYDGIKHEWVEEVIDLEQFLMKSVRFRFRMLSDSYVSFAGIFIDDIRLLLYSLGGNAVPESERPHACVLEQSYPNPFNPISEIGFQIAESEHVILKVYDLLGREVATLVKERKAPGTYTVKFDARGLASGVYFYRLQAGAFVQTKKMILAK